MQFPMSPYRAGVTHGGNLREYRGFWVVHTRVARGAELRCLTPEQNFFDGYPAQMCRINALAVLRAAMRGWRGCLVLSLR